ncbi:hypothetical protein B0H21DRAFT_519572 [Amylocystis lapponica]|nr:hypothetical protein B0H21DRAFT_519572 [Amylocystis lapponica]
MASTQVIDRLSRQVPSQEGTEERAFNGPDWDVVFASSLAFNAWLSEDPFAGPSSNVPSLAWDGTPSSSSSSLVATPSDIPWTWADEPRCETAGPSAMPEGVIAFQSPFEERRHLPEVARDHWPSVGSPAPSATFGGARYHDAPSQPSAPQRRARAYHPYQRTGRADTRTERGLEPVFAPAIGTYEHRAYVAPPAMVPAPSSSVPALPPPSHEHVRNPARSHEPSINGQVQCLWRNCPQWMAPEAVAAHICHAHDAMAGLDKDGRVKCRRCPSGKQCTGRVLPENFAMHIWRVHFQDKFIFSG